MVGRGDDVGEIAQIGAHADAPDVAKYRNVTEIFSDFVKIEHGLSAACRSQDGRMLRLNPLLRRALRCLVTLWLVVTLVFVASRLSGDPLYHLVPPGTPDLQREALRSQLGLDRSLLQQYLRYLSEVAAGDFGMSF